MARWTITKNNGGGLTTVLTISILHTHSRRLDYHPHVHVVMPAAAIDAGERLWRTKTGKANQSYLFNHKALAKVFRAKLLTAIREQGLELPACYPKTWVVDVKSVGSGRQGAGLSGALSL